MHSTMSMRSQVLAKGTTGEYLVFERASSERHEFLEGEIFAMGGASERHNLIVTNVVRELGQALKSRPCRVYANDLRVKVAASGLYTYPDVVVACGQSHFDDEQRDTLLDPTLLIEVLSPSSEAYDRGEKFEHYRKLESLREYVLIAQERPHIEQFVRQSDGQWLLSEWSGLDAAVLLGSIGATLVLAEVYDKVEL
jgi:Uma2 family endonuclease